MRNVIVDNVEYTIYGPDDKPDIPIGTPVYGRSDLPYDLAESNILLFWQFDCVKNGEYQFEGFEPNGITYKTNGISWNFIAIKTPTIVPVWIADPAQALGLIGQSFIYADNIVDGASIGKLTGIDPDSTCPFEIDDSSGWKFIKPVSVLTIAEVRKLFNIPDSVRIVG